MCEYIFQLSTYVEPRKSYDYAVEVMNDFVIKGNIDQLNNFIKSYHKDETQYRILQIDYFTNGGQNSTVYDNIEDYRDQEYEVVENENFKM
jgi:hypothetical protein